MTSFPTFAKIRAERAAREMRGVVLPFQPRTPEQETAAENTHAASWGWTWPHHSVHIWERVVLHLPFQTLNLKRLHGLIF